MVVYPKKRGEHENLLSPISLQPWRLFHQHRFSGKGLPRGIHTNQVNPGAYSSATIIIAIPGDAVCTGSHVTAKQALHFLSLQIVDIELHPCAFSQTEGDGSAGVEGIGIVCVQGSS